MSVCWIIPEYRKSFHCMYFLAKSNSLTQILISIAAVTYVEFLEWSNLHI